MDVIYFSHSITSFPDVGYKFQTFKSYFAAKRTGSWCRISDDTRKSFSFLFAQIGAAVVGACNVKFFDNF